MLYIVHVVNSAAALVQHVRITSSEIEKRKFHWRSAVDGMGWKCDFFGTCVVDRARLYKHTALSDAAAAAQPSK